MGAEPKSLSRGRQRPAYQPKNIRCESCGAGLTVKSEHSELVVCDYCGSHLDVSKEEQTVLGKGGAQKFHFALELGDSFRYQAARYEIIARLAYDEDFTGDPADMTREYLLYNPRKGTLWLGEYQHQYSLSSASHVMPVEDPFEVGRGDVLKTHDGQRWVAEGRGVYQLAYVDGALPWLARIGDRVHYAEFTEASASGRLFEATRSAGEMEFGMGRGLSLDLVRRATGKPDLGRDAPAPLHRSGAGMAKARKAYLQVMVAALIAVLINGFLAVYCGFQGTEVLDEHFTADELTEGVFSQPFDITGDGAVTRFKARASIDNAWMALNVALVRSDEMMVDEYESDLEYYHGYEGGEHWSEGSRSRSALIKIPQPGTYKLFLQAVSAKGEGRSNRAMHNLTITVVDNAQPWSRFAAAGGFSLAVLLVVGTFFFKWKEED
jgi:hypothetical protein